jgi:hypothetical protein
MTSAAATTVRCVVSTRAEDSDEVTAQPQSFAGSDFLQHLDGLDPYSASADGLDEAMLQAQLNRLNAGDRVRVRKHLGLVPNGPVEPSDDPHAGEKALAKMRHPSVARVWRLRPARPNSDHSVG